MDGEIGPFLDAVEGEREWDEVDEYGEFPPGMCAGSDSGSVSPTTITKGAKMVEAQNISKKEPIHKRKEPSSDDEIRDYGEGGDKGGVTTPSGK